MYQETTVYCLRFDALDESLQGLCEAAAAKPPMTIKSKSFSESLERRSLKSVFI